MRTENQNENINTRCEMCGTYQISKVVQSNSKAHFTTSMLSIMLSDLDPVLHKHFHTEFVINVIVILLVVDCLQEDIKLVNKCSER